MTTVAITGVAGHVGRRLSLALDRRDDIDHIVGIDVVAPRRCATTKLTFRQLDVRDPDLVDALHGIDVVVHLAARVPRPRDVEVARSINVDGARNVAAAAQTVGARQLIHVSSVFAYGAHPDNDLPLTEASPLRATADLPLGQHAREVEAWLADRWAGSSGPGGPDGPGGSGADAPTLTVLRLAMVVGPGMDNVITRLLESPRITTIRGHRPPLQFLHLDDAVGAIEHAIDRQVAGTYNVCAEGWLSFDEVTAIASRRTVDVPEEVAYSAADRLWRLGIGEHPPGIVDHLMHPWVMKADELISTGWRPAATNRDALAAAVEEHAAYVALGGARASKRSLARATASFLGALLGVVVVRRSRRRRRAEADAGH